VFLSRGQVLVLSILVNLVLPLLALAPLAAWSPIPVLANVAYVLCLGGFIYFLYRTASWDFIGYFWRYVILSLFLTAAFISLLLPHAQTWTPWQIRLTGLILTATLIFIYLDVNILRASAWPRRFIELDFPFRGGTYAITSGGNGRFSRFMNYHYRAPIHKQGGTNFSMRFAVDIVKLNRAGRQVADVLKPDPRQYAAFGEIIYSPLAGMVHQVVDGIDDNIPFSRNYPYNVGNRVVIRDGDFYIVLGHMRKNSIRVKVGQQIRAGEVLGSVGCSGLAPNPHVHMQVSQCEDGRFWEGQGVPIIFRQKINPLKNTIIRT